jgi:hypothetical protein
MHDFVKISEMKVLRTRSTSRHLVHVKGSTAFLPDLACIPTLYINLLESETHYIDIERPTRGPAVLLVT